MVNQILLLHNLQFSIDDLRKFLLLNFYLHFYYPTIIHVTEINTWCRTAVGTGLCARDTSWCGGGDNVGNLAEYTKSDTILQVTFFSLHSMFLNITYVTVSCLIIFQMFQSGLVQVFWHVIICISTYRIQEMICIFYFLYFCFTYSVQDEGGVHNLHSNKIKFVY